MTKTELKDRIRKVIKNDYARVNDIDSGDSLGLVEDIIAADDRIDELDLPSSPKHIS
jgi:hypothetical protein